jgi:Fur family transcriptional regulator, peroxide stress response regulator
MKTIQRNSILNYLKNSTSHPTAKDIYMAVSKKEKDIISLATVYNTLTLMKKKGLVRELAIPNFDQKRYDPNVIPHAHLICSNCGKIADLHLALHFGISDEHKQGFSIQDSEINFYGLCPICKKKANTPSSQRGVKKKTS